MFYHLNRTLIRLAATAIILAFLVIPSSASEPREFKIGVRAYQGAELARKMWQPTVDYLNRHLPEYHFRLVPVVDYNEFERDIAEGSVDFMISDPAFYVQCESRYGVTRIATLAKKHRGLYTNKYGCIVFTRADRHDIQGIKDLKNKSIMGVAPRGFAGWLMAVRELRSRGIDPDSYFSKITFAGGKGPPVVKAVEKGTVDAGTVRTGLLEMMESRGLIRKADFKILDPIDYEFFPYETSTRLYPEFPFAKLRHVNPGDGEKVLIALLGIQESDSAAKAGHFARWSIPQQYSDVIKLMQELELDPFVKKVSVGEFFRDNPLFGASIAGLIGLLVSFLVVREVKNQVISAEKQRLAVTLRSIGDGVITTDTNSNVVLLNKVAEELTGWTFAEAFGRPVTEVFKIVNEKSGSPCENPVQKVLESGKIIGLANHTILISRDGNRISIADSGAPILDSCQKIIGVVLVFRDVSEVKKIEEQRERDALRTQILLDLHKNAPQLQGKELYGYALERAVELTESTIGYIHEVEEVDGETTIILTQWNKEALKHCTASYDTHHPLSRAGIWADSIRLKKPVIQNDYQNNPDKKGYPEGHFPVTRHMGIPVIDDGKLRLVFGVGNKRSNYNENDIANIQLIANELQKIVAQKRFATKQRQLELQLRQAQKMEAIGLMAGGVAHDLNNILSGIVAYPELLLLQLSRDSELRSPIEAIQSSGKRAAAVISDLLTVARGAASVREPHNLNSIIQEYLNSLECQQLKTSYPKVAFNEQFEAESPIISCSPIHIKKIIMNLVMNSAEAIGDAGNILISTSNQFVGESASVNWI